jgi:hypothetical protein
LTGFLDEEELMLSACLGEDGMHLFLAIASFAGTGSGVENDVERRLRGDRTHI